MKSAVPIPKRMAHLDRDERGYPIPVMVYRDRQGRPHFTINNQATRFRLFLEDQCSICGRALMRLRWFVGGPLSAFHENGAYIDPPMHRDCMRYAMRVCPYLAMPSWGRSIGARTLTAPAPSLVLFDLTQPQLSERPTVFVCVGATGQTLTRSGKVIPNRPYAAVEYWQHGKPLPEDQAMRLAQDALTAQEARQ